MKKSELPAVVDTLQESGILISRKAHGAHHRAPFEGNYCIVSGIWNEFLDDGGSDSGFFRRLERVVAATTGVEPRCWNEPKYELYEQQSAGYQ
jgi:ubiquitin-conjugating enzyme E2 variant